MNDKQNSAAGRHSIAQVFVFLLLGVFAVFSTLMVLLGAQLYRGTVSETETHADQRVLYSYLSNVVRSNDMGGEVCVEERSGVMVLVLGVDIQDEKYETLVYEYEGMLRELFISADQEFVPSYGEEICPVTSIRPEITGGMLAIGITDVQGNEDTLHIALRSRKLPSDAQNGAVPEAAGSASEMTDEAAEEQAETEAEDTDAGQNNEE